VALAPASPERFKPINAAVRSGGRVTILRADVEAGGSRWPAGTVFLDAVAAKAAAVKAVPGLVWSPVAAQPAAAQALAAPRVGLYKPWLASMDEGWTRFLLEQYGFEPRSLDNKTIRAGKLNVGLDAIVLPDVSKEVIASGKPKRDEGEMKYFADLPPDYAGGLDKDGAKALKEFVEGGGTLIAMGASTEYLLDELNLPVRNTLAKAKPEEYACPGALLRARVEAGHPVTYGLPAEVPLFQDKALAFGTVLPGAEMERWVLASYPAEARDILLSGWVQGEERLTRRAAAVALTYGKGRVVLLGFRPQHRAQTPATFGFLFNALYWATMRM
jgi:hypothetical protein